MIRTYVLLESQTQLTPSQQQRWRPQTDLFEIGDDLIVRMEVAGMRQDEFSITVHDNSIISISGVRDDKSCKDLFYRMEIPFGEFEIDVELPPGYSIDRDRITAAYDNGFLTIRCPKVKPRRIRINTAH